MNNGLKNVLSAIAGAAVGVLAVWKAMERKYAAISEEEIASVKRVFAKKQQTELYRELQLRGASVEELAAVETVCGKYHLPIRTRKEEKEQAEETLDAMLERNGYSSYTTRKTAPEAHVRVGLDRTKPYVITPDEFGEMDGYDAATLTYYADGVLCDENGDPVDDVDAAIGVASLSHMGEYEEDCIYVRNEARRCDYEVLMDVRGYETDISPHRPG